MKGAIYARISTTEGRQHLRNQIEELRNYAKRMRWKVVQVYTDQASGATESRPGLDTLLTQVAAHPFDLVLVWDLSRLTRRGPASAFEYLSRLRSAGVELWSLKEEHFRTPGPVGQFLISVAAFVAEQERAALSARVRAGIARARRNGTTLGRPRELLNLEKLAALRSRIPPTSIRECAAILGASKSKIARLVGPKKGSALALRA